MKPSPRPLTAFVGLALTVLTLSTPAAAGQPSKLDKVLRGARRDGAVHRVIIQTRPGQRAALRAALQRHRDVVISDHPGIEALTVTLHGEDLAALDANPAVVSVSSDAEVTAFAAQAAKKVPTVSILRETLGVNAVPFTGAGVAVAVVDSGISATKDLSGSIAGFWDFTQGGIATRPRDDFGHGTHVAGIIASSGAESNKEFMGVAPGVRLYGFRVLDGKGRGQTSDVVRALEFIVANKLSAAPGAFKIDVINLSLGHPVYEPAASDPLVRAVEKAVRAGIVVVTAAGNIGMDGNGDTGYAGVTSPGNAPSAITVGASDTNQTARVSDDRVASFSSRGPTWFDGAAKPDVVAPGVGLTSDAPRNSSLFRLYPELKASPKIGTGTFGKLSGTSMAAAVATGVASLALHASRTVDTDGSGMTPNTLKAVLQFTAFQLKDARGFAYDALTQGTGELNARGAVAMALAIDTDMPVGTPWLRLPVPPVTPIGGALVPWSRALLWDDNIVWGTSALEIHAAQWDDNIVWGTSVENDNIVWGTSDIDNIVWGTAAGTWANDLVWANRIVGLMSDADNIVWGTADGLDEDNIVWGTYDGDNIVWGTWDGDNIVWGTSDDDNIVWGTFTEADNIVWGTWDGDNIVWGTSDVDNIVWGTGAKVGR